MSRLPAPVSDARAERASDIALLVARLLLGAVILAHGAGKLADLGAAAQGFERLGVPLPAVSVLLAAAVEVGGGLLIVAGAFLPVAGILVALDMVGAGWFAGHWTGGIVGEDGWEPVGVILAAALVLAAAGPGRISVEHALARRRATEPDARG